MTTPKAPTITLPRMDDESAPAYAARVAYCTMGPDRSLAAVGQKLGKSSTLMARWSAKHGWTDSARQYDATLARVTTTTAIAQYRAEVEENRVRYQKTGRGLHTVAGRLLERLAKMTDDVELTVSDLNAIVRALMAAADLEAHALGIGDLLLRLADGDTDDELHSTE